MLSKNLLELSQRLAALRKQKREQEEAVKATNAEIDEVETAMKTMMVTADLPSFTHGGNRFTLSIQSYPQPIAEQKDRLYAEFRNRGFDSLFSIHHSLLKSTLGELISNNDDVIPDWLNGLVKTFEKSTIKVTKG